MSHQPPHHPPIHPARYPARGGNRLALHVGELTFFRALELASAEARGRVWMAVNFLHPEFRLPSGRSLWQWLEDMAGRGLDVRVLFWRNPAFSDSPRIFHGSPEHLEQLRARPGGWHARWDSSIRPGHCHHQKTWLIDAGLPGERAYVGGIVKTRTDLRLRARDGRPGHRHDVTLEVTGPAAADVADNFIERWNHARQTIAGPSPGDALSPTPPAGPAGGARVQALRTVAPGLYPSAPAGEQDILRAYRAAFDAARETIYLENQHPGELSLLLALRDALCRGVRVLMVVPAEPMPAIFQEKARADALKPGEGPTRYSPVFEALADLGDQPGFTLAALRRPGVGEVYCHAKLAVVDGAWLTAGSANLVDLSMAPDHTELNLAVWDAGFARGSLRTLLAGHLDRPPTGAEPADWLRDAAAVARVNRERPPAPLDGALYALDPVTYPVS